MMATIGKTVEGASPVENGWAPSFIQTKVVALEYGRITQISAYLKWGPADKSAKGVLFSHDTINDRPLAKLDEGVSVPVTFYQFNDFPSLSYVMATGEILWIGVYCEGAPYSSGDPVTGHKTMVWAQSTYPTVPEVYNPTFAPWVTDLEAAIYATYTPTAAPPQGTLEVHAYEDSVEVGASVEVVGVGTYTTPFTIPLNVGFYTLNATYGVHPTQTQTVEILEGQTTIVDFNFVLPPTHLLTVDSTPVQGIPFTLERI